MTAHRVLLESLYENEAFFVDEIDRVLSQPENIRLFPDDALSAGGGWLFMPGEPGSGDWNIARMIGDGRVAFEHVHLLPAPETHLLVPETEAAIFIGHYKQLSSLLLFVSDETVATGKKTGMTGANDSSATAGYEEDPESGRIYLELIAEGFKLSFRTFDSSVTDPSGPGFAIYLLRDGHVQGYIKSIHATRNCDEVYIEIIPELRGRGYGAKILKLAVKKVRQQNRNLIYLVDEINQASVATARSAGLTQIATIRRFLLD